MSKYVTLSWNSTREIGRIRRHRAEKPDVEVMMCLGPMPPDASDFPGGIPALGANLHQGIPIRWGGVGTWIRLVALQHCCTVFIYALLSIPYIVIWRIGRGSNSDAYSWNSTGKVGRIGRHLAEKPDVEVTMCLGPMPPDASDFTGGLPAYYNGPGCMRHTTSCTVIQN